MQEFVLLSYQSYSANVVPTVYAKRGSRKASPFWLCKLNRLMDLESEADLHTSEGLVAVSTIDNVGDVRSDGNAVGSCD